MASGSRREADYILVPMPVKTATRESPRNGRWERGRSAIQTILDCSPKVSNVEFLPRCGENYARWPSVIRRRTSR